MNKAATKQLIFGDTMIAEMVEKYPEVVPFLVEEYGFHCVSCFISGFEVLEDGARVHGIDGEDFTELLVNVNRIATGELVYIPS